MSSEIKDNYSNIFFPENTPEILPSFNQPIAFLSNICKIGGRSLNIFSEFMKTAVQQTALTIGKIVVVSILSTLLIATATLTALSAITCIGRSYKLKKNEEPTLFHQMIALCDELNEVIAITLRYRIPYNNEVLQNADDQANSPQFILIQPTSGSPYLHSVPSPIVYAPGYLDEPETLRQTCRELANKTGCTIYVVKYRSRFQAIEEHAKDLNRVVERALADTRKTDLFIVGHSMGGLVTGTYLTEHKRPEIDIKKWVTIASPLKGTPVAYAGLGKCAKQMRPSSAFMQTFHQKDKQELMQTIPSMHIYTKTDLIVPYTSAKKMQPNAQEHMCSKPYGHLAVRSCSEITEILHQMISLK
jgi:hypothetical protein